MGPPFSTSELSQVFLLESKSPAITGDFFVSSIALNAQLKRPAAWASMV